MGILDIICLYYIYVYSHAVENPLILRRQAFGDFDEVLQNRWSWELEKLPFSLT